MTIPTSGRKPDKKYEAARNALIPIAEAYANKECGSKPPKKVRGDDDARNAWTAKWNRVFHSKMDRLWEQKNAA